jgi:hypothetical protein
MPSKKRTRSVGGEGNVGASDIADVMTPVAVPVPVRSADWLAVDAMCRAGERAGVPTRVAFEWAMLCRIAGMPTAAIVEAFASRWVQ